MKENEFAGKTVLVTGSGKGLGRSIAVYFASLGAHVIVHYNKNRQAAEETMDEIRACSGSAVMVQADLSSDPGIEVLSETIREAGGVDILVNNAAVQFNTNFDEYSEENFFRIFRTNVGGYALMMTRVIPHMKQQGWGRIINISSIHAKRPTTFDPGYSMTKGAIKMLTREAAIELASYGITVNSVELGYVEVGAKSGNPQDIFTQEMLEREPLFPQKQLYTWGRKILPSDVGPVAGFLAQEESSHLTGISIRLDDGAILL